MGGYIVIIYFTVHHWLLLASSKLRSSPRPVATIKTGRVRMRLLLVAWR